MNREVSQIKGAGRRIPGRVNGIGKGPNIGNSMVCSGENANNIIKV